ncbi:MAG: TPM domain-containing protein [bacterium]
MLKRVAAIVYICLALAVCVYAKVASAGASAARASHGGEYPPRGGSAEGAPEVERVMDDAFFLDKSDRGSLADYLDGIYRESGADVRAVFVSKAEDDLEGYARGRVRTLGMGRESKARSLLLVYDVAGRRLRIEVGPGLEHVFPDGFVGYLMREQTSAFFAAGDPWMGIKATMFVITNRLREAALREPYDPRKIAYIRDSVRLDAGAGATASAALNVDPSRLGSAKLTGKDSARFAPQPTVALAHARYLEALHDGYFQPNLPLYTPGTSVVLQHFPITPPYAAFILYSEFGHQYRIVERGDLAILYFTTTPIVSPHFFHRTEAGWQFDIAADVRDTREHIGSAYTWGMNRTDDAYMRAFAEIFSTYGGKIRPKLNDNRPLPLFRPADTK